MLGKMGVLTSDQLTPNSVSFHKFKLVYFWPEKKWYSPERCIWGGNAEIEGEVTISTHYTDLENLFVRVLKVKAPSLATLVQELKRISSSSPSVDKVKNLIWQINSMNPSAKDLSPIYHSRIFPVRKGNAAPELCSREREFAIIDGQKLGNAFKTGVSILDFSQIEEVWKLQSFLSGLGLKERYLSKLIAKESCSTHHLKGLQTEHRLTEDLRRKAYALYR
jgi:hypothetical protein